MCCILGRNQDYLDLAINHTLAVVRTREWLTSVPHILKPSVPITPTFTKHKMTMNPSFVARFVTESKRGLKKGEEFLGPILRERSSKMDTLGGEWPDKPVSVGQI